MPRKVLSILSIALLPLATVSESSDCNPQNGILANKVYLQGDAGFDDARMDQFASMLGTQADAKKRLNPTVLVYCSEEAHVQAAVRFAANCGYTVTVRSGGHSYTGSSSCNFDRCMQLDLQYMNKTSVNGLQITADPGVRLSDAEDFLGKHHQTFPHGGCTRVGFGGHLQSSAWGMLSHAFGSGLDFVESFRMVHADGSVHTHSRNDTNSTVYKSVLGSSPGSWGIITQFHIQGIPDTKCLMTRFIVIRIEWSKANCLAAMRQTHFIAKDQEQRGLRDMKIILAIEPRSEAESTEVFIQVFAIWTGIDSGPMLPKWTELYLRPFWNLPHKKFPMSVDMPMDLSAAVKGMTSPWTNHNDRYAIGSWHSDYWWSDEFLQALTDELQERVDLAPDAYPAMQFLPLGLQSQWSRNAGMNSLPWRDTRNYVDDWMYIKNESRYDEVAERMRRFREKNHHFWISKDGIDRYTWMSPLTIYPNATDMKIQSVARSFFPNQTQFHQLRLLKQELDPKDLFANKGTIPLPGTMYHEAGPALTVI